MKKNLSRVLALALVLASLLSLTAGAFADGTKVVIPNKFSRLESQLPEREAQPTVRTKTEKGEIMVRVAGDPDNVYANWLGYGEEKEEVNLDNGLGYVELEGHKYQLGAKWNNKQYRSYFAFDPDLEEWVPVEYKGTVKVGNREMKLIEDMRKPIVDILEDKAWAWVYDYKNTDTVEAEDEVSDPVKPTSYADGLLIAGLPKQPKEAGSNDNHYGLTEGTEWISDKDVDIKNGKYQNEYWTDELYDANGLLIASNIYATNDKGDAAEKIGWTYMVPFYQFYEEITGLESNGAPNYAWIVEKGPWTATYTRAGKLVIVEKDEENTDYFKTGLAGNKGHVTWQFRQTDGGTKWYVSSATEEYAEGDIAKAEAVYNVRGELVRYFLTYRTGEDETYKIKYTPDNKPGYGWYTGVDAITGDTNKAETASSKKWVDQKTGKLTDMVELDWGLTALKDWTNPPRLAK